MLLDPEPLGGGPGLGESHLTGNLTQRRRHSPLYSGAGTGEFGQGRRGQFALLEDHYLLGLVDVDEG